MSESATEVLRNLLDERNVELVDTGDGSTLIPAQTATNVAWDVNTWPSGKDMGDCLWVQNRHPLTPEQAIAATLGGGKLTAEQVRDAVKRGATFDYGEIGEYVSRENWQAIADELNAMLGGGECEWESKDVGINDEKTQA